MMAVDVEENCENSSNDEPPTSSTKRGVRTSVLDHFTLLCSNSELTRVDRGVKLLTYVLSSAGQDSIEDEKELSYALKRLLRGIGSSRASAREGFYSALTTLLSHRTDITITYVVEQINKELQLKGQSKSEVGEACTGHVLVSGAVLRSGLFSRSSEEERALLIETLLNAGAKRTYLGLAAYAFIVDYIEQNSEEDVTEKLWPHLKSHLSRPLSEHSLDSLYCLFATAAKYPSLVKKIVKKKMGYPTLICQESLTIICDKIMNTPEFASVHHPIYTVFGKELANSELMIDFWTKGLELKLSMKNQNRIIILLNIIVSILKNINDTTLIPELLTSRFVIHVMNWFKAFNSSGVKLKLKKFRGKKKRDEDEEDESVQEVIYKAKDFFDALIELIKSDKMDKTAIYKVTEKLLFNPGDIMIGEITNTKIVRTLMDEMDFDGIKLLGDKLMKIITNDDRKINADGSSRIWTNTERLRGAEMLTHLVNHRLAMDNIKWRIRKMQFLAKLSLFRLSEEGSGVSAELAVALKKCFFRCLTTNLPKLESLLKVLTSLVDFIDNILSDEKNLKNLSKPYSPELLSSWKNMVKFNKQLNDSETNSKAHTVFKILSFHSGLLLFGDLMSEHATIESLKEVQSCYEHFVKDTAKSDKKKVKELTEGEIVEDEPEWIEVLVDVFLNFLSRESLLLRKVVQCVFRLLSEYLTPSAIGQIVSVLDPDSDANPLEKHAEQSDEEDDHVSDKEMNGHDHESKGDEDDDTEDESSESDNSDEDMENEENITASDQLRMAVQKALGSAAPETDTESVDVDDMDEKEGIKIDKALSEAFRMLQQSKGKKTKNDKKNDKSLMDFRMRVLDLIDIYLEKEPSMELCLGMLSPLSRCLEFSIKDSTQLPLESKLRRCIRTLTSVKNFSSVEGVTVDLLADYLKAILNRGTRTLFVFQAMGDVISKCSSFIIRCLQKIKPTQTPSKKKKKHKHCPVQEICKESLVTFFMKRDCLLPVILFHDLLLSTWDGKWQMLPIIVEHSVKKEVRPFRRNEGLEMINGFYKNLKRLLQTETAVEISDRLQSVEEGLTEKSVAILQENSIVNERYFTIMMKLFVTIKSYHNSVNESRDNIKWNEITPHIQECRKGLKLKANNEYKSVCRLLQLEMIKNATNVIAKQNGNESTDSGHDSNTDDDVKTKKEKKLKKKKDRKENGVDNKQKQANRVKKEISKKEAKRLRAEASGEGLQHVSFGKFLESNINVDDKPVADDSDVDEPKKRKTSESESPVKKHKKIKSFS